MMLKTGAEGCQRSHDLFLISTGAKVGDFSHFLRNAGYEIFHAPFSKSIKHFRDVCKIIRMVNPDVVHLHTERAALLYSMAAALCGKPSVRSIHNEFEFHGFLRFRRILTRAFSRLLGTTQISCSPSVKRMEKRLFYNPTITVDNWANVPTDFLQMIGEANCANNGTLRFISIANESPAKNLKALFDGILLARKEGSDVSLIHCGSVGQELSQISSSSGGSIRVVGTVDNVFEYLSCSDAYVCTSLNEGGPLSLIEAASCGIYCMTTMVGLAERLEPLEAVIIIQPTARSLADAIHKFLLIPSDIRTENAKRLREYTRRRFNARRGAKMFGIIYEKRLRGES